MKHRGAVISAALLAIGALGVLDWRTGPLFSITILYVIPVGFVSWYAGRRAGMLFSGLCIAIWLVADFNTLGTRVPFGIDAWNGFVSLVLLLLISYTLATTKRSLDTEAATVKAVQESLLPDSVPRIPGLEIGAFYRPAGNLSGDYYDLIDIGEDRLVICLADVAGKGTGPALLMANLQGSVRALVNGRPHLPTICQRLNTLVGVGSPGSFVTFVMAIIDARARQVTYVSAGHDPVLLFKSGGRESRLASTGVPLGIFPDTVYQEVTIPLDPGDRLVFYTDGITEARNAEDREFGVDGLARLMVEFRDEEPGRLANRVVQTLRSYQRGTPQDDATLVVIRLRTEPA
jgi:serine phosphatase RsbU (regulator of sigma subunit)